MNIHFATARLDRRVKIKVIGVGGAGGNAVNRMIESGLQDVDFFAVNTDSQALEASRAHQTLVIGSNLTRGLGAGGDPEIGRQAAEEDRDLVEALVQDADMVFVTAGMGGGTGTGAAPLVAEAARAGGALTVAVVTRPFAFEGTRRMDQAEAGLEALRHQVDALLVIPNERLMEIEVPDSGMTTVFQMADNVLYEATRGISDIIARHAVVNLDFADVRTVMRGSGAAIMGSGRAAGADRSRKAAEQAISSPLLESVDIQGSRAVLVYLTAASVSREDLKDAMNHVQQAAGSDAHIFFGFAQDETLGEDLQVTVIATGFAVRAQVADRVRQMAAACLDDTAGIEEPCPEAHEPVIMTMVQGDSLPGMRPDQPARQTDQADAEDGSRSILLEEQADPDGRDQGHTGIQDPAEPEQTAGPVHPAAPEWAGESRAPGLFGAVPAEHAAKQAVQAASAGSGEACMVAAAGGSADQAPASAARGRLSMTGQQFLDPLGLVTLQDREQGPASPGLKFRRTDSTQEMLRPAWERKYVD